MALRSREWGLRQPGALGLNPPLPEVAQKPARSLAALGPSRLVQIKPIPPLSFLLEQGSPRRMRHCLRLQASWFTPALLLRRTHLEKPEIQRWETELQKLLQVNARPRLLLEMPHSLLASCCRRLD